MKVLHTEVAAGEAKWYKYRGGYENKFGIHGPNSFYGIKFTKGDVLSVQTLNGKIIVLRDKSKVAIPADHRSNVTNFLKYCTQINEPKSEPEPKTVKKASPNKKADLPGNKALVKKLDSFVKLFKRYRDKFPATTAAHIELFKWARAFSEYKTSGSVKLVRGTKLRGGDYAVGKTFKLGHARELISFSSRSSVAQRFARYSDGVGPRTIKGTSYVIQADIPWSDILVSAEILKAIARKVDKLERTDELLADYAIAEFLNDEAYDLAQNEAEYFVLTSDVKAKIVAKFVDGEKV